MIKHLDYDDVSFNQFFNIDNSYQIITIFIIIFDSYTFQGISIQMIEKAQFYGDDPMARFGHTITPISKDKAILFGGAVGNTGKYVITGDTFLCDFTQRKWKKLQNRGLPPSTRAAHCTTAVQNNIFVFGGALGGGQLSDDNLYVLDISALTDKAYWSVKNTNGTSPGARYGHIMAFLKPYLIIHGGNTGNEPVGDIWVIDIFSKNIWEKIDTGYQNPAPRVYHSASVCRTGTASGMLVVFGGRGTDQSPLNDTWGLRKHRDGRLDWMRAPYKLGSHPAQRYQHRTLFVGTLLLVIGGRNNQVGQSMPLDIYDTDSSDWYSLPNIQRFRHACFMFDGHIFIHGGFDQINPSIPTESILNLDLGRLFSQNEANKSLFKGLAYQLGHETITHNSNPLLSKKSSKQQRRTSIHGYPNTNQSHRHEKMDLEYDANRPQKRNIQTNKSIRICPQAVVANFDDQRDIKKIQIDQLPTQHKRLTNNISLSNSFSQMSQKIYRYFLNSLFCRPSAHIIFPIPGQYIDKLLQGVQKFIDEEQTMLKIKTPVKIFGDLHGQISQLNRLFQAFGSPSDDSTNVNGDIQYTNYLFLGDYVDRGTKSVETILLLFSLKLKYPRSIFLLRGSHQDRTINRSMGFGDECALKFKQNIDDQSSFFSRCNKIFDKLPLAALVDDDIFCVHGGIGGTLKKIEDLDYINLPKKINHDPKTKQDKIIYELLWTDLNRGKTETQFTPNQQHDYFKSKVNFKFNENRAATFCEQNDLMTIIRSHQPVKQGYQSRQSIITLFSISDYGQMGNKGAIILAKKNQQLVPKVLNPLTTRDRWISQQQLAKRASNNAQDNILRNVGFTPLKK